MLDAGPKLRGSLPLIGHLGRMRRDPLTTLVAASRIGDVARIDLGPRGEAYVVTHPDGVKRVLLENQPNYSKRTLGFDSLRLFLGQGLLTSEGDFWRKQRRIAQPAFHHRNLQAFGTIMQQEGESLADRWEARAATGESFDVARDMMQVTLSIVGRCLFSTDPDAQSSAIGRHLDVMLERFIRRITSPMVLPLSWPTAGNRRIRLAIDELHRIVDEIVAQRRIAPASGDRPTARRARDDGGNTRLDVVALGAPPGHRSPARRAVGRFGRRSDRRRCARPRAARQPRGPRSDAPLPARLDRRAPG